MRKLNAMLSLAAFALLSLLWGRPVRADQPPDNVQGNWTIYSSNIETGEEVTKHVQIAQYGDRITGFFEGPNQSGPIQGKVNGHHIEFSTVTRTVLTFRGQIYGDNMSGMVGVHGKHAPWQAERTSGGPQALVQPQVTYSQPAMTAPAPAYAPQPAQPQYPGAPAAQSSPAPTPAPLTSEQLNAMVAPIALYPDSLVAQVLAAATNPQEVSAAEYWMSQNTNLSGAALSQAVDQQPWDPSVKALTQFPSVLANLAKNLSWTSSLGQAYENQGADVMAAVQVMRAKAQAAGTLQTNSQITVTQQSPNVIVIQPTNPQVVYVPQYNPAIVFGAPVVVPLYTPPVVFAGPTLTFGAGIAVFGGGGFVAGGFGWGWHAWGCNWGGGGGNTIIFNHTTYINNSTWSRNTYNGYHPWGPGPHGPGPYGPAGRPGSYVGPNGYYHPDPGYHPGTDTHYGPNGGYHPNGYFGPNGGWHQDVPGTNPASQPNGGNNGNHGLIGGNGGVQNLNAGRNGSGPGGYSNGMNNTGAQQRTASNNLGSEHANNASYGSRGWDQNRSRMSGDGAMNRAESNRGRASMAGRHPQEHMARERAPAEHHFGGGGGRRR